VHISSLRGVEHFGGERALAPRDQEKPMTLTLRQGVFLLALGILSGCPELGNGDRKSEQRDAADFERVDNMSELDVVVEQGEAFNVRVSIDENLLDHVDTVVESGTLFIRTHGIVRELVKGPHVRITMPLLTGLRSSGSGDVDALDFQDSAEVSLEATGSGDLSWTGSADALDVEASGSGDLTLHGSAGQLDGHVSGSGDVAGRDCPLDSATVHVSGSGDAQFTVNGDLDASVSGSGDLDIYGTPTIVRRADTGSGDIRLHLP
jgi:hypothetical protein